MPSERARAAVASPEASSVRITLSTMSCGRPSKVRRSVRSARYAGMTTTMRRPFSMSAFLLLLRRAALRLVLLLDVKAMQYPVDDRREHDRRDHQHRESGVERVDSGEELSPRRLRIVHRAHAREDHRGVDERIEPVERFEPVISRHADGERDDDHDEADTPRLHQALPVDLRECEALVAVLEHHVASPADSRGGVSSAKSLASGDPGSVRLL